MDSKNKTLSKITSIAMVVGLVLLLAAAVAFFQWLTSPEKPAVTFILIAIGALVGAIAFFAGQFFNRRISASVSIERVEPLLKETFTVDNYEPGKHIPDKHVDAFQWDSISGSQLISGTYHHVLFFFSNISLTQSISDYEPSIHLFSGQAVTLRHTRMFNGKIFLHRPKKQSLFRSESPIDCKELTDVFSVESTKPDQLSEDLDAELIQRILNFSNLVGEEVHIALESERITLYFTGDHVLLESDLKSVDPETRIRADIDLIRQVLDYWTGTSDLFPVSAE